MTVPGLSLGMTSVRCRCGRQTLAPMIGALYSTATCVKCGDTLCFEQDCFSVTYGLTDLRSHEPPRNSGEGTAVNGPMPLEEKPDANERA